MARNGRPVMDLLTWTIVNRRYLAPNVPFELPSHLYLADIYQCTARHMAIKKAGQIGLSEYAVSRSFHMCDLRQGNVFYIMPTDEDVSDFSQLRFGPALEASEYLESIVIDASSGSKRGADRVKMKRIRDNFIVFRGGRVGNDGRARQLKSVPADLVVRDEVDEMDERVQEISRKRLGHSPIKEELDISTPTYTNFGIDALWLESDQREWHVECLRCGLKQILKIENCIIEMDDLERPVAWHGQEENRAWIACGKCHMEMDPLAPGEWVPTYPGRDIVGFHPTKLHTNQVKLITIVRGLITTNETRRKEIFNQDLGEAHTPRGGRLTDSDLNLCKREYAHGRREGVISFMGVDVGKVLHVTIRAGSDREMKRPQLFAGEVTKFSELDRLIKQFHVKCCVIDALPETRKARDFQKSQPKGLVWLAYYTLDHKSPDPIVWDSKKWNVNVDRSRALDMTFDRFFDQTNTLPAHIQSVRDYYTHLKALVRTIVDGPRGEKVVRYVNSGADHYGHSENYNTIASKRPLGWARG